MFVVGAALTAVAFALAWLLREVPLRATTHEAADLAAEEAIAAAGGAEAIVGGGDAEEAAPLAEPDRPHREQRNSTRAAGRWNCGFEGA